MMPTLDGNRLILLQNLGQSVWLDELHRELLRSGELDALIRRDGISGVTTNPTIFAKAFASNAGYKVASKKLDARDQSGQQVYEQLALEDIRAAAGLLRKTYERSEGRDGFVSMEVAPAYAHDAERTVAEAERLWHAIDRANVMIKVPAADAGLLAIRQLIARGINVNATLIFGTGRYAQVLEAYLQGLEDRVAAGLSLDRIAGVASVFVSRIDTMVDRKLDALRDDKHPRGAPLRGTVAIRIAQLVYQHFKRIIATPRWQALAARHAQLQRPLWASTGTKDARYSDVKYIDALVGANTVTTMPLATMYAFRDHGAPSLRLEEGLLSAAELPGQLAQLGINLDEVSRELEREGLAAFAASMESLLKALRND